MSTAPYHCSKAPLFFGPPGGFPRAWVGWARLDPRRGGGGAKIEACRGSARVTRWALSEWSDFYGGLGKMSVSRGCWPVKSEHAVTFQYLQPNSADICTILIHVPSLIAAIACYWLMRISNFQISCAKMTIGKMRSIKAVCNIGFTSSISHKNKPPV